MVRAVDRSGVGEQQLRMHLPDVVHELRRVPPSVVEADPREAVRAEHCGARRLVAQVRVQPVRVGVAVQVVARQQPRGPAGGVLVRRGMRGSLRTLHPCAGAPGPARASARDHRRRPGPTAGPAPPATAPRRGSSLRGRGPRARTALRGLPGRRPSRTRRRRAAGHQRGGPPGSRRCTRSCARFSFAHLQRPAVQRTRQVQHRGQRTVGAGHRQRQRIRRKGVGGRDQRTDPCDIAEHQLGCVQGTDSGAELQREPPARTDLRC